MNDNKETQKITKYKLIMESMQGLKTLYLIAIASLAFGAFFQFLSPLVIRLTIDSVLGGQPLNLPFGLAEPINRLGGVPFLLKNLWIASLALFTLTAITNVFAYLRGYLGAYCSEELVRRIRNRLYDHLQHLPFLWYSTIQAGDIIQRCTSDIDTIRRFFGQQLIQIGRGVSIVAIVLPIMLSLNKKMALMAMIVVPVIFGYSIFFYQRVRNQFKDADEEEGQLTAVLEESMSGIRVVRAFNRQEYEIERFNKSADSYRGKCYRLIHTLAIYWATSDMLCFFQIGTVLVYGTHLAISGSITLGTFVVFMIYVSSFLWPIREMGRILTDLGRAVVSLERVREILATPVEDAGGSYIIPENERLQGKVEFKNVTFDYQNEAPMLKEINLTINAGETIALIGATGSGKSTLCHLIPRLIDYSGGEILIDGRELTSFNKKSLRSHISIVLQEPFLYSKTIAENIRIAHPNAVYRDIEQAARETALHDTIIDFEQGYETIVGEKGITLSGGQRQRTAIARVFIKDPSILILDDALSAVDSQTEKLIQEQLLKRKGRATTIIITHRFTSVVIADRIIVMEDGKIVQQGTHRQLLQQEGPYHRIWDIQHQLESGA